MQWSLPGAGACPRSWGRPVSEILGEASVGGGLLDLADSFQDDTEASELVLANEALRRNLDSLPEV